jgi:DNA-directed RNA polymerase subunit beta
LLKKIARWKILSFKNVVYGKNRVRRNYSKVKTNVELPNLIEIQTKSFEWFMKEGIKDLFKEISPIKDYSEKFELYFDDYEFDEPKFDIPTAKRKDANYSRALKASVRFVNNETGEIIVKKDGNDKIYLGDFPVMTPWGTFVINGAERVIVTQIIRSAGVFFSKEVDKKSGRSLFAGQVIPTRGVWIEYEMGSRDIWYAKLDRSKKIPLTTFLRAVGINSNKEIKKLFGTSQYLQNTFEKDETFGSDDALEQLYDKLKPGEKSTPDGARNYLANHLFDTRRYDLANVGRYKVNKKLDVISRLQGIGANNCRFAEDIINIETGEVVFQKDQIIDQNAIETLKANRKELLRRTFKY